jgi:hypothetical protein
MHCQDTVRIPLRARSGSIRAYTVVDATDAAWVSQWQWRMDTNGYAYRWDHGHIRVSLHRALLGLQGNTPHVDHINRDQLDNRRINLRETTHAGNMQNRKRHRHSRSQYRGVQWDVKGQSWRARVTINGRRFNLGSFKDEAVAGEVAKAARLTLMPFATD